MILIDLFLVNDTFHIIIFQLKITVLYIFIGFAAFLSAFFNNYARNIGFFSSEILFRFSRRFI